VTKLSGGERRRVALCKLLAAEAGNAAARRTDQPPGRRIRGLARTLPARIRGHCVIIVTHDRYFLDNVTGWILELDRGSGIPYQGNYSSWLEQKRKRLEQEEREESARQRTLRHELEWIQASPRARQAKSKARITAYETCCTKAREKEGQAQIVIPPGPRLGDLVIQAESLRKGYGNRLLIDDLSFKLPPGGIVGVIGPNGAGKTTLFRMITGQEEPDGGVIRVGDTVALGYVDQSRDALKDDASVWEEISGGLDEIQLGKRTMQSRAYVAVQLQGRRPAEEGRPALRR
jgi:sulfate-transporting ATPase